MGADFLSQFVNQPDLVVACEGITRGRAIHTVVLGVVLALAIAIVGPGVVRQLVNRRELDVVEAVLVVREVFASGRAVFSAVMRVLRAVDAVRVVFG